MQKTASKAIQETNSNGGILIGYDILLDPSKLLLSALPYRPHRLLVRQLDLANFVRELQMLEQLVAGKIKPAPFSIQLHRSLIELEMGHLIELQRDLNRLPKLDELREFFLNERDGLLDHIGNWTFAGDDPQNLIPSLLFIRELINEDRKAIVQEHEEYHKISAEGLIPREAFEDVLTREIEHYPFLPRYQHEYKTRLSLIQTALTNEWPIATSNTHFSTWLGNSDLSPWHFKRQSQSSVETTIGFSQKRFTFLTRSRSFDKRSIMSYLRRLFESKRSFKSVNS
jgi:hypothetical protein